MYMCSNTGLPGWAELRNRTRLCLHPILKLSIRAAVRTYILPERVAAQMLHCTSPTPEYRLAESLFPPLTSPPPPPSVEFSKHVLQCNILSTL